MSEHASAITNIIITVMRYIIAASVFTSYLIKLYACRLLLFTFIYGVLIHTVISGKAPHAHRRATARPPWILLSLSLQEMPSSIRQSPAATAATKGGTAGGSLPANTKHLYDIYTTSAQRRKRWADVLYMLYKCFVFAGIARDEDVGPTLYKRYTNVLRLIARQSKAHRWLMSGLTSQMLTRRWNNIGPTLHVSGWKKSTATWLQGEEALTTMRNSRLISSLSPTEHITLSKILVTRVNLHIEGKSVISSIIYAATTSFLPFFRINLLKNWSYMHAE